MNQAISDSRMYEIEKELQANVKRLNTMKCERSLAEFTKQAWHIIEPGTPLMWNWHLDTLCAYLEATMDPQIHLTRLIINIPPGSLKSVLVSVMFPAWMWIKNPQKRVLGVSNSQDLAVRDSRRTKQIITDEWYTKQWPLALTADQAAKTNYENVAGGFRVSLGITANITGKRGDCFTKDTLVDTEFGSKHITEIEVGDKVWSWNTVTQCKELKPVDALYSSEEDRKVITLELSDRSTVTCTPDHKFWTEEQGMVSAKDLLLNKSVTASESLYSLLSTSELSGQPRSGISRVHNLRAFFGAKYPSSIISYWRNKVFSYIGPRSPTPNFVYSTKSYSVLRNTVRSRASAKKNITNVRGCKNVLTSGKGPMFDSITHVISLSAIRQITENIISMIPIQVSNFTSSIRFFTNKRSCCALVGVEHFSNSVDIRTDSKIPFAIWAKFSHLPFFKVFNSAINDSIQTTNSTNVTDFVHTLKAGDGTPLFVTNIINHVVKAPVYCLQVRHNHNMFVMSNKDYSDSFGALVSNCILMDDPHDASTAQSDLIRKSVLDIYDTKLSTRVNSQQHSVIILIMQRLHAQDLTGHLLLKKKTKWTHVVMPMHYDSAFTFDAAKDIGRPDLDDPRQEDELLFPNLFPLDTVDKLEEDMGTYACTPAETPIRMWNGGSKRIADIEVGDVVMGYESKIGKLDNPVPSTVTEVFNYANRAVLEYTMGDGNVVRATRDHKWYKPLSHSAEVKYNKIECSNIAGKATSTLQCAPLNGKNSLNKVIRYRHLGKQTVYALTTKTGNYVAWDHISSNSAGQLEQRPSPKGGGILRQAWFRILDSTAELPVCEHIFISCDTAYSEKDMANNSYSAFTTWGVFWNKAQQRDCILLLDVWYGQVDYPELRRHAHKMDKDKKPDVWLIEKKASGQCHDDKTQVLTNNGWKFFADVDYDVDLLHTKHLNGKKGRHKDPCRWQKALHFVDEYYSGDMHKIKIGVAELFVTPNHRMLTNNGFVYAKDLDNTHKLGAAKFKVNIEYYEGRIYCAQVPDETLFTRRVVNGIPTRPVWSGNSLVQDLRQSGLMVRTYVPTTDKVSRAYAIQPMLESGQVWIPDRKWAHNFAYKMGTFPTGDPVSFDLADTCTQALLYIRNGMYVTHPDDLDHSPADIRRVSAYGSHISDILPEDEKKKALVSDEDMWRK